MRSHRCASLILVPLLAPCAAAADSADAELSALRAEVARLSARLERLEAARPGVPVDTLSATAAAAPRAPEADWVQRVRFDGDLRYRHEWIDEQGDPDRTRHRVRMRLGASGTLTDDVTVFLRLATGGDDPRSTNQTLGENVSRKDVGVDLGYFDWAFGDGLHALGGKMKNPIRRPADSRFIDADVSPEGLALTWSNAGFFATGYGFWGVERGSDDDTLWLGAQAGYSGQWGERATFRTAFGYSDWVNVEGRAPFFEGDALGNSLDAAGNLIYDYDLVDAFATLELDVADLPLELYGHWSVNTEADDGDTAYSFGLVLGRASAPRLWEIGWAYHDHPKDALFAQVVDSDFAGGRTDARGHSFRAGLGLTRNVSASLTYHANEVEVDVGDRHDYDRLMLDLSFRY